MITIDEFAFCFFSTSQSDMDRQETELDKLSDKYHIEKWYRKERNPLNYLSFSQMVNDGVDDTDSEFMIFCNPKTILKISDIEFILDKLSNGYCFASKVSFGLFGMSKELIRRVGMLDERFIGGGWEDNDFAIRLLDFGKATWWEYDFSGYDGYFSRSQNLKHLSTSIFRKKYNINNNKKTVTINNQFYSHKKISNRHSNTNLEIYNSWLDSSHNQGDLIFGEYLTDYNIERNDTTRTEYFTDFQINITYNDSNFFIELLSDYNVSVGFTVLKDSLNGRTVLIDSHLTKNTWYRSHIPNINSYYGNIEVRLFVDDNQFYNNTINLGKELVLNFSLPVLI